MNFVDIKPGKSVEGQEIPAFRTEEKSYKYIYLMAGVHGDEVEGVYVLNELFTWLKQNEFDCPLIVVPVLNVDGYRNGERVNSHGVDLNRNFPTPDWSAEFKEDRYNPGPEPLSEPENKYLITLFNRYRPGLVISFHSYKPMINFNGDCKDVADFMSKYNKYVVVDSIGYPTPGSLGTYGPDDYKTAVITFECPPITEKLTLKKIWEENEKGLKAMFEQPALFRYLS